MNEDLRKWFGKGKTGTSGGGWDRYGSDGQKLVNVVMVKKVEYAKHFITRKSSKTWTERKEICKKKKTEQKKW